jgi:hypothetical protein
MVDKRGRRILAGGDRYARAGTEKGMSDLLVLIAVLAGWIVLNRWLLPRMGVST